MLNEKIGNFCTYFIQFLLGFSRETTSGVSPSVTLKIIPNHKKRPKIEKKLQDFVKITANFLSK